MTRFLTLLAAVTMLGCGSSQGSALRVTVDFSISQAQCARVVVTGRSAVQTGPLQRTGQNLVVGIAPTYGLGNAVTVEVNGWGKTDCTGPQMAAARPVQVTFPSEGVTEVPMRLEDFGVVDGGTDGGGGSDGGVDGGADGGGSTDGGADAGTDAGAQDAGRLEFPFPPTNFNPAIDPALTAGNVLLDCGTSTYDSKTNVFGNWCGRPTPIPVVVTRAFADDVVVLPMRGLTVANGAVLKFTGDKAVILAVYGDATVQGSITADAVLEVAGPGGSKAINCLTVSGGAGAVLTGAGGGGAGHLNLGSIGGYGPGNLLSFGLGGLNAGLTFPDPLRGGCSGGTGAVRSAADALTLAGGGGGGVQLSAAGKLTFSGRLSVAGGGGRGATANKSGGGGGGSGGGILLEAQTLQLSGSAKLLANGGAGGGGADNNTKGDDGEDGHSADDDQAQGGAEGGGQAGKGGDGESAQGADNAGEASQGNNGGGGGGAASAGRIHLRGVGSCTKTGGVLVSPSFTGACP